MKSSQCVVNYEQYSSSEGVVNKITVSHPDIPFKNSKLEIKYVHVDRFKLDEPATLDGYVCAIIFFAMQYSRVIKVNGVVSEEFARNMLLFSEAWACWLPEKYSPIRIEALDYISSRKRSFSKGVVDIFGPKKTQKKAISCFSGGADAAFTLFRHAVKNGQLPKNQRYNLQDVVMVHGFDVGYENTKDFDSLRRRLQPIFDYHGVSSHIVRTNIRCNEVQIWEHCFMAHLASVLHQFSDAFCYGLAGSSEPYSNMVNACGSHPATDYLLSGIDFKIVHDGAGFSRTQKISQLLSNDVLIDNLRVCWQGDMQDRNCGKCEKCIRTMLNFIAAGAVVPKCFDEGLTVLQIEELVIPTPILLEEFRSILLFAKTNGRGENELIRALENKLCEATNSAIK